MSNYRWQREIDQLRAELAEAHAQLKADNFDRRELADHWQAEIEAHAKTKARLKEAMDLLCDGLTWLENWPEPGTRDIVRSYEAFLSGGGA